MQEDQRIRITPDIPLELSCSTDQLPIECQNSLFLCLDYELRKHEQDVALKVEETRLRELTFQRLQCLIRTAFNGKYEVRKFGSSITGLELSDSDIDVILYDTEAQSAACETVKANNVMKKLNYFMPIIGKELESLPMIKIPILKYRDKVTNVNVDICFKEAQGTEGTNYILEQLNLYPNFYRPFIIFWKSHMRNLPEIGDSAKGGLASFTIMMMLTFLLKQFERQNVEIPNIGFLFYHFISFYVAFDSEKYGIDMTTAQFFNKSDSSSNDPQRKKQLYISAVTDQENNVARATSPAQFFEFQQYLKSYVNVFTPKTPDSGSDISELLKMTKTPLSSIHRIPESMNTSRETSLHVYSNLFSNHFKSNKETTIPWDTICQSILGKVQNECKSYLRAPGPKTRWEVGKWDNDRPRGRYQDGDRQNKRKRDNKMKDKKNDAAKSKGESLSSSPTKQLLERQSRKDGKQKFSGRNHPVASGSQLDSDNPTPKKKSRHA